MSSTLHKPELQGFALSDHRWVLAALRGLRNGIITGVRIRTPYVLQAVIYAALYRDELLFERLRFVIKQCFFHGRNLGLFVLIYKTICTVLRHFGVRGGIECWIAGFVGGYYGFGESKGVSGAVNNQIVLYLFARGIEGMIRSSVQREILPASMDPRTPQGFRYFAGFSLALILYMTDYEENNLRRGFYATMENLYYESNSGPMLPPKNFLFFVVVVLASYFGDVMPNTRARNLQLNNVLRVVDWKPWDAPS